MTRAKTTSGHVTLPLSRQELVTLAMLTMVGASAFDSPSRVCAEVRGRFSRLFGVEITDAGIADVVTRLQSLMTGAETVAIGGDETRE